MEHAEQTLKKGLAAIPADLKNGLYWIKSGLMLRATTVLKNNDPRALSAINELVETVARLFGENHQEIAPSLQNELVLLSLFAKNRAAAVALATLEIDPSDTYPFTLAVRSQLAAALSVPCETYGKLTVTPTEAKFLKDLEAIATRRPTDLDATDTFWSSLRNKRFANTIFEYQNIFGPALEFLQGS